MLKPVKICLCSSQEDEPFREKLKKHLKLLERQGRVKLSDDSDILAGLEYENERETNLKTAQIILLLISPDFVNSDNCYNQAEQAMARYESGEAKVIPILLSPVNWQETSFGKLRPLPINEQPISSWTSQEEAFYEVAEGIFKVVNQLGPLLYGQNSSEKADQTYREIISKQGPFVCPNCGYIHLSEE